MSAAHAEMLPPGLAEFLVVVLAASAVGILGILAAHLIGVFA